VIGPAARLARRINVGAAQEVGLNVHLLDFEFAFLDPFVNPLMTGIEPTDVSSHSHYAGFLLNFQ
jgi:hypothetical protein